MNWLEKIQAPKFYRYMFYKSYQLGIKIKTDDAPIAAEYVMIVTLMCQLFFLFTVIEYISGTNIWLKYFSGIDKWKLLIGVILFIGAIYILFVYKKKWKQIVAEFEGENKKQSKKGFVYLLFYVIISLGMFFGPFIWTEIFGPWWK